MVFFLFLMVFVYLYLFVFFRGFLSESWDLLFFLIDFEFVCGFRLFGREYFLDSRKEKRRRRKLNIFNIVFVILIYGWRLGLGISRLGIGGCYSLDRRRFVFSEVSWSVGRGVLGAGERGVVFGDVFKRK